jgi:CheY-like chemotaxis protein
MVELMIEKKSQPGAEIILVIEDDRDLRELLIKMLSSEGYSVVGANEYLTKPFSAQELKNCVKSQLEKAKSLEERVMEKIEKIEDFIQERIAELETVIKRQGMEIGRISVEKLKLEENLNKKEEELSKESLVIIDTNNTLQNIEKHINAEVNRQDISMNERNTLLKLKNHINNRNLFVNNWTVFQMQFNKTHPGFLGKIVELYPHLSQMELTLTCALALNLSTDQLAKMFSILPESVRKNKYRLKNRMGLECGKSLREHILRLRIDGN